MGAESQMRGVVLAALRKLHAVAIENGVEKGTPDVNCVAGWIELKHLDAWPRHETTPVRVPKFYPEQREWLRTRCEHGGQAWLLLRVDKEWILLWGAWAAENLGSVTRSALYARTQLIEEKLGLRCAWRDGFNPAELCASLLRAMPGVTR